MTKLANSFAPLEMDAKVNRMSLAAIFLMALVVLCGPLASADSSSANQQNGGGGDASSEQFAPKRQYFIAPRIGRSMHAQQQSSPSIWSSLEGANLLSPGQIQPTRGYPSPLRSSLLYLIGNRRLVGQRSASGLLPQARIGRRAAPSGLLPQPRVGRRSLGGPSEQLDGSEAGEMTRDELLDGPGYAQSQQEVAVAATSDNAAINEAVESLING